MKTYKFNGLVYKRGVHGRMFIQMGNGWIKSSKTFEEVSRGAELQRGNRRRDALEADELAFVGGSK